LFWRKRKERDMNTIQVTNQLGDTVNYTEAEVLRFINKAGELDAASNRTSDEVRSHAQTRNKVRDFFSEREWQDRETTVTLDEVNELLNDIGSHAIQTTFSGTITIQVNFSDLNADDEDDAVNKIQDEIQVELYGAVLSVDDVTVDEIEAE